MRIHVTTEKVRKGMKTNRNTYAGDSMATFTILVKFKRKRVVLHVSAGQLNTNSHTELKVYSHHRTRWLYDGRVSVKNIVP